jgi:hypothetical protein
MNQKAIRFNNRNSWVLVLSGDKRQFSNLWVNNAQTLSFAVKFFKFFSLLTDKPLVRVFKRGLMYIPSSFIAKKIGKKKLSANRRDLSCKKLFCNSEKLSPLIGLFRLRLCDFSRWEWKKKDALNLLAKIEYSAFNLNRSSSAQIMALYVGGQLEKPVKQRDFNFKTNFKNGVRKIVQTFLKAKTADSICGVKVTCSGRWKKTKSGRKQIFIFSRGKLLTQSLSFFVDTSSYRGQTKYGAFSLKFSITYNNV